MENNELWIGMFYEKQWTPFVKGIIEIRSLNKHPKSPLGQTTIQLQTVNFKTIVERWTSPLTQLKLCLNPLSCWNSTWISTSLKIIEIHYYRGTGIRMGPGISRSRKFFIPVFFIENFSFQILRVWNV